MESDLTAPSVFELEAAFPLALLLPLLLVGRSQISDCCRPFGHQEVILVSLRLVDLGEPSLLFMKRCSAGSKVTLRLSVILLNVDFFRIDSELFALVKAEILLLFIQLFRF